MKKSHGTLKWKLIGVLSASAISSLIYLKMPNMDVHESKPLLTQKHDYSRTLYGIPELNLSHYRLDDDKYFKYVAKGVVNIGRADPTQNPLWYSMYLKKLEDERKKAELEKLLQEQQQIQNQLGNLQNFLNGLQGNQQQGDTFQQGDNTSSQTDSVNGNNSNGETVNQDGSSLDQQPSTENGENNNPPTMTKEEYDQIKNGMTYEEVTKIVGGDGKLVESSDGSNEKIEMYAWEGTGEPGANAIITFVEGKVQLKIQHGLR